MYSYISEDRQLLVVDETLLMAPAGGPHLEIPAQPEPGHCIRHIGQFSVQRNRTLQTVSLPQTLDSIGPYAFKGCEALQAVEIPASVTRIETGAFCDCRGLKRVVLTAGTALQSEVFSGCVSMQEVCLRMDAGQYEDLVQHSRQLSGGDMCAATGSPPWLANLVQGFGFKKVILSAPDVPLLLPDPLDPGRRQIRSVYVSMSCLRFDGESGSITEDEAVRMMIRSGRLNNGHPDAEQRNDRFLRINAAPPYAQVTVPIFRCVQKTQDSALIALRFKTGWWYWLSAQLFRFRGRSYYLYSRNYLTADDACPYSRLDMAIYDGDGLVTDRRLSREIYAKYKLPALL